MTHRPRWRIVGAILARQGPAFGLLLVPPLAVALYEGETALALALAAPTALIAATIPLSARITLAEDVRRIEAVLSLVVVFVLAIVLTTPAYATLGLGALDALFEATSALTTTGFSMIDTPEDLPLAGHVLRAWSQWCGGLVIAVAGLAFLMDQGPVARAMGFADFGETTFATSVRAHARALLLAYLALTVIGIAGALALVPGPTEGPLLALAAVSTGGMAPRADSLAAYPFGAQAFVIVLSSLGALSLAVPVLLYRKPGLHILGSPPVALFARTVVVSLAAAALLLLLSGVTGFAGIAPALLNVLSLQSTTGFSVGPLEGPAPLVVLMIALMAVGGQIGSTAGGMKVDRVRVLMGAISLTFQRLRSPAGAVLRLRLDNEIVPQDRVQFAVALVGVYFFSLLLIWIAFTLRGLPPQDSLFDIVSALSTVGAGLGVIGPDLPPDLKILTILAMMLGRIEFFGLLVLALPKTWKRRD